MISQQDVRAAAERIGSRVRRTPVIQAADSLYFKLEYTQHAGSFKARGMLNQILAAMSRGEVPDAGVVAASGGNAGLAAAYAARELGLTAEVYVPVTAPEVKVAKLGQLGARVVQAGSEYAEAYAEATVRAEQTGALFCHAYDNPDMVAGNGTLGLELLEQIPGGFHTVMVAVGGGGLLGGVIAAVRDHAQVVAVEPTRAQSLHAALDAGRPVDVPVSGVAADSLGARRAGEIGYALAASAHARSVLIDDKAIVEARHRLWEDYRIVVEPGSAAAYAALTSGVYTPTDGEQVVVLLCGANISIAV
ncbi:serine/threonine dehydratase [Mangrovihabitans endophyticus]|uniref:Threonine dehydratase n=1 Tax=Mangrovihabitans endophyticus TaxID=1751298 RepID=A0A8J3BZS9_9ACTN|nr:serine/threonine dehydratase [Mangrovihabitans endophyticus]GGK88081.1 threonine dehydratase [Mangrovihabitans endophyticus]